MENANTPTPRNRKYLNSPTPQPPPIGFAADQNLTPEFFAVLATLGLEVVIVRFEAKQGFPQVEAHLARELMAAKVGDFDSSAFKEGAAYHFFHVNDMGKAMRVLKDTLESMELLSITTILHAESASELRIYYPPNDPQTQAVKI